MKIILLENVKSLGRKYQVVDVAPGYARNFLFKNALAQPATVRSLEGLEIRQESEAEKAGQEKEKLKNLAEKIKGQELIIEKRVNKEGKLFGSVTEKDIAKALFEKGISLGDGKVVIEEPIKELGEHRVGIIFPHDLKAELNFSVKNEQDI